jgi:hypothetical protein
MYKAPSAALEKYNAKARTNKDSIKIAAENYAYKGIKGLGLDSKQAEKLANKIIPIVKMQITSDRNKAATRAKAAVEKEKRADKKAAINKAFGGNK